MEVTMNRWNNVLHAERNCPKVMRMVLVLVGLLIAFPLTAQQYFADSRGVALRGYDVVSYHENGKAVQGSAQFQQRWGGVVWYFSSDEHATLFANNPEQYAPEYGGYCAYAVANNSLAPVDPEAFSVIDDKLYLNYSRSVQRRWSRSREEYIRVGNRNWPSLRRTLSQ